jgi:methionine-rich copper-binding protein CopC
MRRLAAALVFVALSCAVTPAGAHSLLLESAPAANSTVDTSPPALRLRFNNRIEKRLSRVRLVDERGQARDLAVAEDGAADQISASVPAVTAGRYRVEWQVLSTDGHVVTGRFSFSVGSGAGVAKPGGPRP